MSGWVTEPIVALIPVVAAMVVLIVLNERDTISTTKGSVIAASALAVATGLWVTIGYVSSRPLTKGFDPVAWSEPQSIRGGFPTERSRMARDLLRDDRYVGAPVSDLHRQLGQADGVRQRPADGVVLLWSLGPAEEAGVEEELVAHLASDETVEWVRIEAGGRIITSAGKAEVTG